MSWTRLDDGWTDQQLLAGLSHQTRWHYLCMIQFCSRTKRFDGFIRAVDARRCSDVDNPDQAVTDLRDIGMIHPAADGYRLHRMEEDHAPPLSVRNRAESNKQAQRRHRAHESGDHALCLAQNCDHATDADSHADSQPDKGTSEVIADSHADSHADKGADTRTGQDRLRTEELPQHKEKLETPVQAEVTTDPWLNGISDESRCLEPGCAGAVTDFLRRTYGQWCAAHADRQAA